MATLTESESKARDLVEADRAATPFSSEDQVLRSAFLACWSSAMPVDRWVEIALAIHGGGIKDSPVWQRRMTGFARRGVMRSYMKDGRRLYEVCL